MLLSVTLLTLPRPEVYYYFQVTPREKVTPITCLCRHRWGRRRYGFSRLAIWHQRETGGWHRPGHFTPRKDPVPIVQKALGLPLSLTMKINTDRNNVP